MSYLEHGIWIYVDPDEQEVELIEETLDLEALCELLRCDATDLVQVQGTLHGYIDGEGEVGERQTRWKLNDVECFGPMLLFHLNEEETEMIPCSEDDREMVEEWVDFLTENFSPSPSQPLELERKEHDA